MIAKRIPSKQRELGRTLRYAVGVSSSAELENYDEQAIRKGVENVRITNCVSETLDHVLDEMEAVQASNRRAKGEKTYHLVISFPMGEIPDSETLNKIEDELVESIGFKNHQRVSAQHHDTDYLHLHVVINQIDPMTFNKHEPYYDKYKLMAECERIEEQYNLSKTNHRSHENDLTRLPTAVRDFEAHQDEQSLLSWVKENLREEMLKATSWKEVHAALMEHGLVMKPKGNGMVVYDLASDTAIKASNIDRQLSSTKLLTRLGVFEENQNEPGRDGIAARTRGATTRADGRDGLSARPDGGSATRADGGRSTARGASGDSTTRANGDGSTTRGGGGFGDDRPGMGGVGGESSQSSRRGGRGSGIHEYDRFEVANKPPTASLSDVPEMSSVGMVGDANGSEVLLQTDAPNELDVEESAKRDGLRRGRDSNRTDATGLDAKDGKFHKGLMPNVNKKTSPLYSQFEMEKRIAQAERKRMQDILKAHKATFTKQTDRWMQLRKDAIKKLKVSPKVKQQMYQDLFKERKQLMADHRAKMQEAQQQIPRVPVWVDYLKREAGAGNAKAIETLRKRKIVEDKLVSSIIKAGDLDKAKDFILKDKNPEILGNGTAIYRMKDGGRLLDREKGIQLEQESVGSAFLALTIAKEKFGDRPLEIKGTDEFKEIVVKAALIYGGMQIRFADPLMEAQRVKGMDAQNPVKSKPVQQQKGNER